jgi:hypothetical protein
MKSLEARIANQEKRVEEERALAQKHLNAARNLKKALNEEQAKGFWKKLFG